MDSVDDLIRHPVVRSVAPPREHIGGREDLRRKAMLWFVEGGAPNVHRVAQLALDAFGDRGVHAIGVELANRWIASFVNELVPDRDPERTSAQIATASPVLTAPWRPMVTGSRSVADSTIASMKAIVPRLSRPDVSGSRPFSIASANSLIVPHGPVHSICLKGTLRARPPRGLIVIRSLATLSSVFVQYISPRSNSSRHSPAQGVILAALTQLPR